jgi:hypothetical protein
LLVDEDSLRREVRSRHVWIDQIYDAALNCATELISKHGSDFEYANISDCERSDVSVKVLATLSRSRSSTDPFMRSSQPDTCPDWYSLFAVIIHRGTAFTGHYFAYIRDVLGQSAVFSACDARLCGTIVGQGNFVLPEESFSDPPKRVQAVTVGTSNETTEKETSICYLICRDAKVNAVLPIFVDGGSPLGLLVGLFTVMTANESEHLDSSGRRTNRKSNTQRQESGSSALTMSVSTLNKQIKANTGETWNNLYKSQYGTLTEYMKSQTDIFALNGQLVTLSVAVERINVVTSEEFGAMLLSNAANPTAPTGAVTTGEGMAGAEVPTFPNVSSLSDHEHPVSAPVGLADAAEWQTATSRKNKRENKHQPSSEPITAAVKDGRALLTAEDEVAATESAQRRGKVRKLAQQIISYHHGNFFEFNDSECKSLPFLGLNKAIEGANTAYLLVYRRVGNDKRLGSTESAPARDVSMETVNSSAGVIKPSPPKYWMDKVASLNDELAQQRESFDQLTHAAFIRILCPAHVRVNYPLLLPRSDLNKRSVPKFDYIEFQFDLRESLQSNIDRILIEHSEQLATLGLISTQNAGTDTDLAASQAPHLSQLSQQHLQQSAKRRTNKSKPHLPQAQQTHTKVSSQTLPKVAHDYNSVAKLCLSELCSFGDSGFFPINKLETGLQSSGSSMMQQTAGDVINRGCYYLLWNGSDIRDTSVPLGNQCLPVKLSVKLLAPVSGTGVVGKSPGAPDQATKKNKPSKVPPVPNIVSTLDSFYVPRNASIYDCCLLACTQLGLDIGSVSISACDRKKGAVKPSSSGSSSAAEWENEIMGSTRSADKHIKESLSSLTVSSTKSDVWKNQIKELTAVCIWSGGGQAKGTPGALQNIYTMTIDSMVNDNDAGTCPLVADELLIEDVGAKGLFAHSLAYSLLAHRNRTLDVFVDVCLGVVKYFSRLASSSSNTVGEKVDTLSILHDEPVKAVPVDLSESIVVKVCGSSLVNQNIVCHRLYWCCRRFQLSGTARLGSSSSLYFPIYSRMNQ